MFNYSIPSLVLKNPKNMKIGNLYVGSLASLEYLKNHHIQAVVSVIEKSPSNLPLQVHHLMIEGADESNFQIKSHFEKSNKFVNYHLEHTNVLIHCAMGISRSVTLVTAYMMSKTKQSPKAIISNIDKVRPGVSPNDGFMYQLEEYFKEITS